MTETGADEETDLPPRDHEPDFDTSGGIIDAFLKALGAAAVGIGGTSIGFLLQSPLLASILGGMGTLTAVMYVAQG